jgi:hypothetical protein
VSFWWGQLHCVGLFGDAVMILLLTKSSIHHLCLFGDAVMILLLTKSSFQGDLLVALMGATAA